MIANKLTIKLCIEGKLHIFNDDEIDSYCNESGKRLVLVESDIAVGYFVNKYGNNPKLCKNCRDSMLHRLEELMVRV